ncbi:DUF1697 domain-containing protein [Nocardioides campestrisoli]|uniref:DUF1697 domain-containing protein n=1 Tax=Nocardioides campestrisoli TaxID=2736757 RepID=UPI0015E69A26|nr:DUF1697 domain-containing protein [Nocardioides campestrisoli]
MTSERERTHVALLRGVNVGAHNRIAMADLRATAASLGWQDVATYVQSGNVVFTSAEQDAGELARALEETIAEHVDVRCGVVVLTREELQQVAAANPYPHETDPKHLHVVFHSRDPGPDTAATLAVAVERAQELGGRDEATLVGRHLYLRTPDGLGRSRLASELTRRPAADAPVGTARNWATVTNLLALLEGPPPG